LKLGDEIPVKADELLKSPELFEKIIKEFDKKIVGEHATRKVVFLCFMGRLVENASLTSYNLIVNDETGSGKDWIVSSIGDIMPEDQFIAKTRITPKAFTYWHNAKFEPDWTWNGKVFYNEDISQEVLNSEVFKVFASSGSNATIVINQMAYDIEIRGKPVLVITTARSTPNNENIRRFGMVNLDTSTDQTVAIMTRQAINAMTGVNSEYDPAITHALGRLKRVKVKIIFADRIARHFPKNLLMRTQFNRFLDYIKAMTALYQFQRLKDEDGFYLSNGQDYQYARECLLKITTNPLMIPLTRNQQKILEAIKEAGGETEYIKLPDIVQKIDFCSESWARSEINRLIEYGFLDKGKEPVENSDRPVMTVRIKQLEALELPNFEDLMK